jgi:hypothetical protein
MDSKTAWGLKRSKQDEVTTWRARRQAAVARGERDGDGHQPLHEAWVWTKTLKLLDGMQVGGRITPMSDEQFAICAVGLRTGHPTHELASAADMEAFWRQEEIERQNLVAAQDRLERRDRIVVAATPAAPRKAA